MKMRHALMALAFLCAQTLLAENATWQKSVRVVFPDFLNAGVDSVSLNAIRERVGEFLVRGELINYTQRPWGSQGQMTLCIEGSSLEHNNAVYAAITKALQETRTENATTAPIVSVSPRTCHSDDILPEPIYGGHGGCRF